MQMRAAIVVGVGALLAVAGCGAASSAPHGIQPSPSASVGPIASMTVSPDTTGPATTSPATSTSTSTSTATPAPAGEVHTKAAADARAQANLAAVRLPAGASPRTATPSPHLTIAPQSTDVTTMVDDATWWVVPGTVAAVTDYVRAHPPYGLQVNFTSAGSDPVSSLSFDNGASGHDEIDVSLAQSGAMVDVRLDAQVIWLTPKSPYDTVGADQHTARLVYTGPDGSPHKTLTLTAAQLARLGKAINALELLPPGPPWSCPEEFGEHAVLTLTTAAHTTSFDIQLDGCRFITISVDGGWATPSRASETRHWRIWYGSSSASRCRRAAHRRCPSRPGPRLSRLAPAPHTPPSMAVA